MLTAKGKNKNLNVHQLWIGQLIMVNPQDQALCIVEDTEDLDRCKAMAPKGRHVLSGNNFLK